MSGDRDLAVELQIAATHYDAGRAELALNLANSMIVENPLYQPAHKLRGAALRALGQLDGSTKAFERALELAPGDVRAMYSLSQLRKVQQGDALNALLGAAAAREQSLSHDERVLLAFALGKAREDQGDFASAFRRFSHGHLLQREIQPYDEANTLTTLKRIAEIFSAHYLKAKSGQGCDSKLPVFVVGMPRSGTTLVEQIIASHPSAHGAGELLAFDGALRKVCRQNSSTGDFLKFVTRMEPALFRAIGADYLSSVESRNSAALRICDKLPSNFRSLGFVHLALPRAAVIHCYRNPLDTCISIFANYFDQPQPYAHDLAALGRYYSAYVSLMTHWRKVLPQDAFLDVNYEDLISDFEHQARRIIGYCGLEWDQRCVEFQQAERPVYTASAVQVRQPLYRSAIGRADHYKRFLEPLLEALGDRAKNR